MSSTEWFLYASKIGPLDYHIICLSVKVAKSKVLLANAPYL